MEYEIEVEDEGECTFDEEGRKIVGEFYVGDDGELYRIADGSPRVAICPITAQPYVTATPGRRKITSAEIRAILDEIV